MCTLSIVSGCGVVDTGVRVTGKSGDATASPTPESSVSPGRREAPSVDAVAVLRADPGVNQDIKDLIAQPCSGDGYGDGWFPVYTSYATLTGTDVRVAIINVQGCADVVACPGVRASYVYRLWEDRTKRVYTSEEALSEVSATGGQLSVQRPIWQPNDPSSCPSGGDMVPLRWDGSKLVAAGE
ncbi:hypothetical protein CDO52_16040 [Nocardiopsis gilva YIM 90087]|uniref:LppP/LprE family lipoprotein n=1 Tax=Nocardiopsis gilva YIM 90087 TaxID=1235441 RepID=A0A223S7M2_9ACTN|nr:hypothetical protein CDO52_16040 [Nocardiopsis gilva YIM 90087]